MAADQPLTPEQAQQVVASLSSSADAAQLVPAEVAARLGDAARALTVLLGPDASVVRAVGRAADFPDDIDALTNAGRELEEAGGFALAIDPLRLAHSAAPQLLEVVVLLASAYRRSSRAGRCVELLAPYGGGAAARNVGIALNWSLASAVIGDLAPARRLLAGLSDVDAQSAAGQEIADVVARAAAVEGAVTLDEQQLRGWTAVLCGSVLLEQADHEDMPEMNGRFAAVWVSDEQLNSGIAFASRALSTVAREPAFVVSAPDRDSQIVASVVGRLWNLPVRSELPASGVGLHVTWDWSGVPPAVSDAVAANDRLVSWAYVVDWTRGHRWSPDVHGIQAQYAYAPWHERLRVVPPPDGSGVGGKAERIPADDRPPDQVAESLAERLAQSSGGAAADPELDQLLTTIRAAPEVFGLTGGRRRSWPAESPVGSNRFTLGS
jgi:hypothetical protein